MRRTVTCQNFYFEKNNMNEFRQELSELLAEVPCRRPPALRRSLKSEWLYATDLLQTTDPDSAAVFLKRAAELGWRAEQDGSWLQMTRSFTEPPEHGFEGPFGEEAACCASLLRRQTETNEAKKQTDDASQWLPANVSEAKKTAERVRILLVKAGEQGPEAYEKACGGLHREWAQRLRKKQALPPVSLRFFCETKKE